MRSFYLTWPGGLTIQGRKSKFAHNVYTNEGIVVPNFSAPWFFRYLRKSSGGEADIRPSSVRGLSINQFQLWTELWQLCTLAIRRDVALLLPKHSLALFHCKLIRAGPDIIPFHSFQQWLAAFHFTHANAAWHQSTALPPPTYCLTWIMILHSPAHFFASFKLHTGTWNGGFLSVHIFKGIKYKIYSKKCHLSVGESRVINCYF